MTPAFSRNQALSFGWSKMNENLSLFIVLCVSSSFIGTIQESLRQAPGFGFLIVDKKMEPIAALRSRADLPQSGTHRNSHSPAEPARRGTQERRRGQAGDQPQDI